MFFNKPKKNYDLEVSPKVQRQNAMNLYKQWGSDSFVKKLPKHKRAKMRKYNLAVARQFDKDTYEGNDVNKGLQMINKQFGFSAPVFMGEIAEFARLRDYVKSELTNPNTLQQANNPTYAPSMTLRRGVKTIGYAGGKGGLNYIRDNKLNRRGRKQFDKYKALFTPQTPQVGEPIKKKRFGVF